MPAGKKSGSDKDNQKRQAEQLANQTGQSKSQAWEDVHQRSGTNDKPSAHRNRSGSESNDSR